MTKVITVKVSKGGVGKTTISSNLAYLLSEKGFRVLLIDLDSQANLTKSFIKEIDEDKFTSSNLLGDDDFDLNYAKYSIKDNLDIIGADSGLYEVSRYLESIKNYHLKLKEKFEDKNFSNYDYIVLDLSPGVSDTLTDISLVASDLLICPTHFDVDSLTGLIHTINDISRLDELKILTKELNYLIVPNRYDLRFKVDNQAIIDMLYENIEEEFIATPIRENSHIKKARMRGITAIEYESAPEKKYEHKKATEDFEELLVKVSKLI
ncbi:MAG: ParA family protein [Candidatus Woesearchaeota archaeon]|jgi:chromosome partitioning protein|nr:ParA family protein [Candidatus Woesearchaeota archaeon]